MSFPRYERYRESGVAWLGEVPEHWEVQRLGRLLFANDGGAWGEDPDGVDDTVVLRSTEQTEDGHWKLDDPSARKLRPAERATTVLREDDLLITKSSGSALHIGKTTIVDAAVAAMGAGFSNFMQRLRPRPDVLLPRLAWYLLNASESRVQFDLLSNSTSGLANINTAILNGLVLVVGEPSEQQAIAAFLDRETAKIDALIEEQRRLIALLKEKRQAVISHAVTKGVKPGVSMQKTGLPWLRSVPAHWSVIPVWLLFSLGRGRVISHEDIADRAGDYPVFSSQTERDGCMGSIGTFDFDGDYLTWTTDGANAGTVFRRSGKFNCTNVCGTLLAKGKGLELEFAKHAIQAATSYFVRQDINPKLMNNVMAGIRIAVPPTAEQRSLVDAIDKVVIADLRVLHACEGAISLLQERRSALISAAVTGKIDVRAYAAKPVVSVKPYNAAFARQVLGGEILSRCNDAHMGRTKLQKLIYLTEHHAQLSEIEGKYTREVAGPLDMKAMRGLARGLEKQHWFREEKQDGRFRYVPLDKHGQHAKYLQGWADRQARIDEVLALLGSATMRQCELVATLYAAWNDLLLDGVDATDDAILQQASTAAGWNASKERTAHEKWVTALGWMKAKELVPTGWGSHTRKPSKRETHEPA